MDISTVFPSKEFPVLWLDDAEFRSRWSCNGDPNVRVWHVSTVFNVRHSVVVGANGIQA
jgi:hypothetical protein